MQTYSDGWSNWEDQLNRKTERRRKAAARKNRKSATAAIAVETALFITTVTLIVLDFAGILSSATVLPLAVFAIIAMSFCAGIVVGAKNN